ncbi:MAG: hypothetical protein PX481_12000 [Microcystis sp. M53603_WE2]|jgi:hypothetical protein|nr:hypothetical protein [Microcystis sp. M53603_WE2]MDJ0539387.1 hypothetical protein [Microcystis sp. M53603_WE2]
MDVFTHFSIVRRERRGIRPEEIKQRRFFDIVLIVLAKEFIMATIL